MASQKNLSFPASIASQLWLIYKMLQWLFMLTFSCYFLQKDKLLEVLNGLGKPFGNFQLFWTSEKIARNYEQYSAYMFIILAKWSGKIRIFLLQLKYEMENSQSKARQIKLDYSELLGMYIINKWGNSVHCNLSFS